MRCCKGTSAWGAMISCGRSICCSTFRSANAGNVLNGIFISLPKANIRFKSSPNSLMAILAFVPDSMASIRWLIGWPISHWRRQSTQLFTYIGHQLLRRNGLSARTELRFPIRSRPHVHPVRRTSCLAGYGLYFGMESSNSSADVPSCRSSSEMPGGMIC